MVTQKSYEYQLILWMLGVGADIAEAKETSHETTNTLRSAVKNERLL